MTSKTLCGLIFRAAHSFLTECGGTWSLYGIREPNAGKVAVSTSGGLMKHAKKCTNKHQYFAQTSQRDEITQLEMFLLLI